MNVNCKGQNAIEFAVIFGLVLAVGIVIVFETTNSFYDVYSDSLLKQGVDRDVERVNLEQGKNYFACSIYFTQRARDITYRVGVCPKASADAEYQDELRDALDSIRNQIRTKTKFTQVDLDYVFPQAGTDLYEKYCPVRGGDDNGFACLACDITPAGAVRVTELDAQPLCWDGDVKLD